MCGEDLLRQRGSTAWHAHNEQRSRIRIAAPSLTSLVDALARHRPDHQVYLATSAFQIGWPDHPSSGRVGFMPGLHCLRVTPASVEHLSQFVTQQCAVRVGQCRIAQHQDGLIYGGVIGFRAIQTQQPAEGERPARTSLQGRELRVSCGVPVAPILGGLSERNQ